MKIIYNVTVKVDITVNDDWLTWMKETHIPDIMMTGKFLDWSIKKILGDDDPAGITYAVQYTAPDMDTFLDYNQHHAQALQQDHKDRYEGKYVAFRTLMELVEESKK